MKNVIKKSALIILALFLFANFMWITGQLWMPYQIKAYVYVSSERRADYLRWYEKANRVGDHCESIHTKMDDINQCYKNGMGKDFLANL